MTYLVSSITNRVRSGNSKMSIKKTGAAKNGTVLDHAKKASTCSQYSAAPYLPLSPGILNNCEMPVGANLVFALLSFPNSLVYRREGEHKVRPYGGCSVVSRATADKTPGTRH